MHRSLQPFTPTVRRLNYDALDNTLGCQSASGVKVQQFNPFTEVCVAAHDANSEIFNRDDRISYCDGPATVGTPGVFGTGWAAWVATAGVRFVIGATGSIVLPSDSTGTPATVYPATVPSKVSCAFSASAALNIAIQKTATLIEISRADDPLTIARYTFNGVSPILFYNGLLYSSNVPGGADVGCFYLNAANPTKAYLRIERDGYATEYTALEEIQVPLAKLIGAEKVGRTYWIYARDIFGNDVTLEASNYSIVVFDKTKLSIGIQKGNYFDAAIVAVPPADKTKMTVGISAGSYFTAAIPTETLPTEKAALSIGIAGGLYA